MEEKQRTKLLAGLLGAAVAVYAGRSLVSRIFLEPIRAAQAKLESTQKNLEALSLQDIQLGAARRNLEDWRAISLPEDPLNAQRLYREWIENLALKCGFLIESVEPGGKNEQKGRYLTVSVDVKAETDLAGLSRFLYLFDQAALLHRVSSLKIDSTGAQGNPRLEVALTAEGMSVFSSGTRNELFTRTRLAGELTEAATEVAVSSVQDLPAAPPFLLRIERELVRVTAVRDSTLTLERGWLGTKPVGHKADAVVELLPVHWDRQNRAFDEYSGFLAASPFALPAPPVTYTPKVVGVSDRTIQPGEEVRFTVKADGVNPALGEPRFTLLDKTEGMQLDETTGEFVWQAPADLAAGRYSATIAMSQTQRPEERVEARLAVTVRVPNAAPVLELAESALVIIGQEFRLQAAARDDGPADQLTFALGAGAPAGLTLDPKTGELKWTAPVSFQPGQYEVEVKVTDGGAEPQSAARRIRLDVQDDAARLTLLTGSVSKDGIWYAWFRNKGTGVSQELKIGDRLQASEISAEIVAIENRSILLADPQGTWKLALGSSLRERVLVTPAVPAAPAATSPEPIPAPL